MALWACALRVRSRQWRAPRPGRRPRPRPCTGAASRKFRQVDSAAGGRQRRFRGHGRARRRPRGADGRLRAGPPRRPGDRLRGGRRRSAASRRPSSSTATASTSAATASSRRSPRCSGCGRTMLGDEFLVRPRLSRIYYDGQVPLLPAPGRGRRRPARRSSSRRSARSRTSGRSCNRGRHARDFEDWVTRASAAASTTRSSARTRRRCGASPGSEIHSQWAAQRIKDFSFWNALLAALHLTRGDADDADRAVPLPAARPGADVGAVPGTRRGARHPGAPPPPRAGDPPRPRRRRRASPIAARRDGRSTCRSTPSCRASRSATWS